MYGRNLDLHAIQHINTVLQLLWRCRKDVRGTSVHFRSISASGSLTRELLPSSSRVRKSTALAAPTVEATSEDQSDDTEPSAPTTALGLRRGQHANFRARSTQ